MSAARRYSMDRLHCEPAGAMMTRRCWLRRTAAGAVASAAFARAVSAQSDAAPVVPLDRNRHPWIDAHSHIWSRNVERYPLANDNTLADLAPPSFTDDELLAVAQRSGVGRVVLIQHHPYHGWDNSYLLDAAAQRPDTFRIVAMVDNFAENPGEQMRRLLARHVTGFRITSSIYGKDWLGGGMDAMWRTAAETGQNISCLINPDEIPQIDRMCRRHPDTPVVIDHFARIGGDGQIREADVAALCRVARRPKTTVKLSAYYALGMKRPPYLDLAPMIRRLLDAFGVERLMWASDSPYQLAGKNSYDDSIALPRERLDFLSDNDRAWLLQKTAERVYFFV